MRVLRCTRTKYLWNPSISLAASVLAFVSPLSTHSLHSHHPRRVAAIGRYSTILFSTMQGNSPTNWEAGSEAALQRCVVPLSSQNYKGSSGRVGVLGGSARYTGAPYYAAMAALKSGSDLAFVFCAEEAALPIKCYSPELMVAPIYNAKRFDELVKSGQKEGPEAKELLEDMVQEVTSMMDKLHALVIGPGLGRCPLVMQGVSEIIEEAKRRELRLVIDADGLFLLTQDDYSNILDGYNRCIFTPNAIEYKRLMDVQKEWKSVVICRKGAEDVIEVDSQEFYRCTEKGGLKRSGGIGDVLAGTLGTMAAWNAVLAATDKATADDIPLSVWTACCVVKEATKRAFGDHGRSMTAPDVLEALGPTVDEMLSKEAC